MFEVPRSWRDPEAAPILDSRFKNPDSGSAGALDESGIPNQESTSFNKYFYQHQPLRPLEDVVAEIRQLETETEGLLEQILKFDLAAVINNEDFERAEQLLEEI